MSIIIWLLTTFGLTYLIKESDIFSPIRIRLIGLHPVIGKLLDCSFCTGFWSGLITYSLLTDDFNLLHFPCYGLSGASISLLFSLLVSRLERS